MAELVTEASQPGIILFFDEIHLLAGVGRTEGGVGADEALKPALARGDIAVIGATTPEEYRTSIALRRGPGQAVHDGECARSWTGSPPARSS